MPFPLGKTGGLIEARSIRRLWLMSCRGFRWVKPAASLKQPERFAGLAGGIEVSAG